MFLDIFLLGFLGGFIIQVHHYINDYKKSQEKTNCKLYKLSENSIEEFDKRYGKTQYQIVKKQKTILGIFYQTDIVVCIFYGVLGGIMAHLIAPSIPFFAFYIGLTSSSFISKF